MKKMLMLLLGTVLALGSVVAPGSAPTASAAVEDGKNLVDNRGFENGTTNGWTCQSCTMTAAQWGTRQSGAWSAYIGGRSNNWAGPVYSLLNKMAQGRKYRFSLWVRQDNGAATENFQIIVRKTVNGVQTFDTVASRNLAKNQFGRLSGEYTLNYSGALTELSFYIQASNATLSYALDNVFVSVVNNTSTFSKIKVSGNKLVDAGNNVKNFKGVNLYSPIETYNDYWDPYYYKKAASWGSNVVRLPITPSQWLSRTDQERWDLLEQSVQWAADYGMQVIIDWHSIGSLVTGHFEGGDGVSTQAQFNDFWTGVANRYKNDPRVIMYEIFNEPVHSDTGWISTESDWIAQRNWANNVVSMIRNIDTVTPIGVAGMNWAGDLQYIGTHPVSGSGIVYIVHPYSFVGSYDSNFGYLTANYPVFATEIGFDNDPNSIYRENRYSGPTRYREGIDAYIRAKGIHWTAWHFGTYGPALLTDFANNGSSTYNVTEAGSWYRDKLLEVNGTAFGTTPAYSAGSEFDKAFDNNITTYFDYANANGGITGIDLGTAKRITKFKFYPRGGFAGRMTGGKFQGSNTSSTSGYVDLATVGTVNDYQWNELTVTDTTAFRYIRYVSPANSYGNVAEIDVLAAP